MVKICMLVANEMVNDSRVLKEARSLVSRGCEVDIFAMHNEGLLKDEVIDGFQVHRIVIKSRIFKTKLFLPVKFLEYFLRTLVGVLKLKVDVIHCHDISPMLIAWLASRIKYCKLIYDSHELEYDRNISKILRLLNRWYERLFINSVDQIIVSDGAYRAKVMKEKNCCKLPMTYVMNCPPKVEVPANERKRLREILNIKADRKLMLYIGNVYYGRGFKAMIEALSFLDNVDLVVMGKPGIDIGVDLIKWQSQFGVDGRVQYIGPFHYSEDILLASGADVGISLIENTCQSYYLSTPTKLFDSIAAGIPIIVSDFPAMKQIVMDNDKGVIGAVVDPLNAQQIAGAIKKILNLDNSEREDIRAREFSLHQHEYNWFVQEQKLFEVYDLVS